LQPSITATPATRQILVPSFLLQPLVENAFKHGFDQVPPPWSLHVGAEVEEGRLKIEVRNTNQPANHGPGDKSGLGLGLIRRRLQLHYPGRHRFHLQQAEGWTVATVELEGLPCFV
jgi:LytS/YehU family sensor histidine kinase